MFQRSLAAVCCAALFVVAELGAQASLGVTGANADNGMLVNDVTLGSAAARAGLVHGDILSSFNGARITGVPSLRALLEQSHPGELVKLGIIRAGKLYQATATLEAVANDADALQRRLAERQRETEELRRQIEAASKAKGAAANPAPPPRAAPGEAARGGNGAGIPAGIYRCRAYSGGGYYVVLTIRILDAANYAEVGDKTERPGQYRFDQQHGKVSWLSGPLKANALGDNRPADFEDDATTSGKVLTVFRGSVAVRCRPGE